MNTSENELIGLIYESVINDDAWPKLMAALVDKLRLRSAGVSTVDSSTGCMAWHFDAGAVVSREYMELYANRYARQDMLFQAMVNASPGTFVASNIHLDMEQVKRTDFYRNWALPQGIHNAAGCVLNKEGNWFTFILIHRNKEEPAFEQRDIDLFDCLVPHLQRAIHMRARVVEMRDEISDLRALIERFPIGVALFDEYARIGPANSRALQVIERHPALQMDGPRLLLTNTGDSRNVGLSIIRAVHASLGLTEYAVDSYHLNYEQEPLTLIVSPFRVKDSDHMTGRALVMFYSPKLGNQPSAGTLSRLYNLTSTEARLCCELVAGRTLEQIAGEQGKKKETVRSQLKQIFAKTGTRRQAELVAQILTSPAMLPDA